MSFYEKLSFKQSYVTIEMYETDISIIQIIQNRLNYLESHVNGMYYENYRDIYSDFMTIRDHSNAVDWIHALNIISRVEDISSPLHISSTIERGFIFCCGKKIHSILDCCVTCGKIYDYPPKKRVQCTHYVSDYLQKWIRIILGIHPIIIPNKIIKGILEFKEEYRYQEIDEDIVKKYLKKEKLYRYYTYINVILIQMQLRDIIRISSDQYNIIKFNCKKIITKFNLYTHALINYQYIIYKVVELFIEEPLRSRILKNIYIPKKKILQNDKIYREICDQINLKFIPTC